MPVYPGDEDLSDAGDLIEDEYSYEFRGFLFGSGTDFITTEVDGILSMPTARDADTDRAFDHGVNPGVLLMGKRIIAFNISIVGDPGSDIEDKMLTMSRIFQPPRIRNTRVMEPLVFMRPGSPKKMCMVRCTKRDFKSNFKVARGLAVGSVELQAPDPAIFSLEPRVEAFSIPSGQTTAAFTIFNDGDFNEGSKPVLQIAGPATNFTIQNLDDSSRTFKIAVALGSADAARIDFKTQKIETRTGLGGPWIENFSILPNDSRWWAILPGANHMVVSRASGNTGLISNGSLTYSDCWQ